MNVLLVRYGEIHLKGQNRPFFERLLLDAIKNSVGVLAKTVIKAQGRFYVEDYADRDEDELVRRLRNVFGIHSVSVARKIEKDWDAIVAAALDIMREEARRREKCSFKVIARRSDKTFEKTSTEMAPLLGGIILDNIPNTVVDVRSYDVALGVEIREFAYIYTNELLGQGGMPTGSNGRAALLLSGGIDSPVAGHMIMKRGVKLECVHFHSYPYTSERALNKVVELARLMSVYCGTLRLHVVPFTEIQKAIHSVCPECETTIIMRRAMMEISQQIARKTGCQALVTGEAIGQVASQTIEGLCCTDDAVTMPVFRPLIGFDKNEIMERARKIGTYETSILPYEDCCTIFTPKHPVTLPKVENIRKSQTLISNWGEFIREAVEKTESQYVQL